MVCRGLNGPQHVLHLLRLVLPAISSSPQSLHVLCCILSFFPRILDYGLVALGLIMRQSLNWIGLGRWWFSLQGSRLPYTDAGVTGPARRRMSTRNDLPQEGSLHASQDPGDGGLSDSLERRRSSHVLQGPQSHAQPFGEDLSAPPPLPDHDVLDLDDVVRESESVKDHPDNARTWLRSFGDLKPGTDVSTKFKDLHSAAESTQSLLSLLTRWVPVWSARAEKARREHKTSRSAVSKEQQDLDWLLCFIYDFLNLGHASLAREELCALIDRITNLCLRTNRQSDINHGIDILYAVASHFQYPGEALEQTMVVLGASAANLQEMPDHLFDCLKTLALSGLSHEALGMLYASVRTPTAENSGKNLAQGRGATRLLRTLLDTRREDGRFLIDLAEFSREMHDAASQGIFRFANDILAATQTMLSSEGRKSEIGLLDWKEVIETLHMCLKTTLVGSGTGTSSGISRSASSPTTLHDEDEKKQFERHMRDREGIAKKLNNALEALWDTLSTESQELLVDYFLAYPQYLESSQALLTLEFVEDQQLLSAEDGHSQDYREKILTHFVQKETVAQACRIKSVQVLANSCGPSDQRAAESTNSNADMPQTWLTTKLLQQLEIEQDKSICDTLMTALEDLATTSFTASPDHAIRIIERFQVLVTSKIASSELSEDRAILAAKALARIFAHSLTANPNTTLKCYEALLEAAGPHSKSRKARLLAMRVLFRLRVDDAGTAYLQMSPESEYLAAALCRTRESALLFNYDLPSSQRHSASSTSLSSRSDTHEVLWIYPDTEDLAADVTYPRPGVAGAVERPPKHMNLGLWLLTIIRAMQSDTDWEIYSYILVHLGAQLNNTSLFLGSLESIVKLRQIVCEQVVNASFREPPPSTGLKKSDVALCLFNILTSLIAYATMRRGSIQKGFGDDLVRAFISGIGATWEGTSRACIHALSICCLEVPSSVASLYPNIVDKMSKSMTQSYLTMHILQFLAEVARLPEVHSNFNQDEITMIFGICIQFLEKSRDQHQASVSSPPGRLSMASRHSGLNFRRPPYRAAMLADVGLPQYASALAYHTMIFWFLSLKLEIRAKYVSWIVPRLVWKNARGEEMIDEQSQVFIDMMQRTAFSDLGETSPNPAFAAVDDGPVSSASWIVGLSVVTVETAGHTGRTQITKRQASGTTHATYEPSTTQLPSHHAPSHTEIRPREVDSYMTTEMLPSHILLQMVTTAAPTSIADQPLSLPKEDFVSRALDVFDRIPTVDSHKIGLLYIGPGQKDECEFLSNTGGTTEYDELLRGLGYVVSLKPPLRFNPQGLQYPRDGEATLAWRDRVAEIVYHVPTMMPTDLEDDPQCITKKSHVGNCHVNIVFNCSGMDWDFDNLKSQLNYVNIVITPASRQRPGDEKGQGLSPQFYKVHVLTTDGFPTISPAAEPKVISGAQLPQFVRLLALNASLFSQAWNAKDNDPEFQSSWRARLQQIKRLKERVMTRTGGGQPGAQGHVPASGTSVPATSSGAGRRTPVPRDELRKDGALAMQLDFSKWTL